MSNSFINSIFGSNSGLSGMIGDYNAIRNGSYGKLLKSYYNSGTNGTASGSGKAGKSKSENVIDRLIEERKNPTVSKEATEANSNLSTSVNSMMSALGNLQSEETYKDSEKDGTAADKMRSALKSYVSSYNDAVTSSKKTTMYNISKNIAGAMAATKENEAALKEFGITINGDGTLTLNEKKLATADVSKVKDFFDGNAAMSYGSKVATRLNRASNYVKEAPTTNSTSEAGGTASTSERPATTSNSKNLMESIANLKSKALFTAATDNDGNKSYDIDGIISEAENFIKYYNATLATARNTGISGVSANLSSIIQKTAKYSGQLSKAGITVGADGKLSLHKDSLKKADMDGVKDSFEKYASAIESDARLLNYYSNTGNGAASGYASDGTYSLSAEDIVSKMYDV